MIENLAYVIIGFAVTYLSLEVAWHFGICKIKDRSKIKPCMFKDIRGIVMAAAPLQTRGGRLY
jgi:hypothetical protein